jgi:hypothetical protein
MALMAEDFPTLDRPAKAISGKVGAGSAPGKEPRKRAFIRVEYPGRGQVVTITL